eukprot:CAMPEP_0118959014 /NCGR_PEP_ID=MMETSP1169-20130426/62917_1 /TAXON_ID=36882 /ORGANISM="Pyramimonas obovata, Strain CCMP722" /LENGTH=452 /DNA_ID=CAMNT_0006907141 /DNA_START=79 /DNA_END=1439 /DNA_ORIENTATION=-
MGNEEKSVSLTSLKRPDPTPASLESHHSRARHPPTEDSPLLPTSEAGQENDLTWKRVATLAYNASYVALFIYFVFQMRCTLVPFLSSDCASETATDLSTEHPPSSAEPFGSPEPAVRETMHINDGSASPVPSSLTIPPRPFLFHVPKTASTYYVELLRMLCRGVDVYGNIMHLVDSEQAGQINTWISMNNGMKACMRTNFSKSSMWHEPIDGEKYANPSHPTLKPLSVSEKYARFPGTFVGMFREPAARLASGFVHDFHDCDWMMRVYFDCVVARRQYRRDNPNSTSPVAWLDGLTGSKREKCVTLVDPPLDLVRTYFSCVKGCATNMLLGVRCGDGAYYVKNGFIMEASRENYFPSEAEVQVAVHRLRTQFVAVGIMEEYVESVARLHQIFRGNEPLDRSLLFPNIRPSYNSELKQKVLDIMRTDGLVDHADGKVYEAAKALFYSQPNVTM